MQQWDYAFFVDNVNYTNEPMCWNTAKFAKYSLNIYSSGWKVFGLYGIQWFFETPPDVITIFLIRNMIYHIHLLAAWSDICVVQTLA